MGWKSCMMCCGGNKNAKDDLQNILKQEEVEEVDEQFVFLEQFPTDRRVENPEYMPAVSRQSSEEYIQDEPKFDYRLRTLDEAEKVTDGDKMHLNTTILLKPYLLQEIRKEKISICKRFKNLFRKKKKKEEYFERKKPRRKSTYRGSATRLDSRMRSNVPFIGELPVPMDTGRVVQLEGEVMSHATRFSLNLACGGTPTSDLAFHFNPRFDQNYVARNSRFSGRWGQEESSSPLKNPFQRGKKFHLTILAGEEEFMIAVNGYHFCSYAYRTARLKIQTVQINGDVTVDSLEYRMVTKYPEIIPDLKDPVISISCEHPLSESMEEKVELPLIVKLTSGFKIGQQIEIVGRIKLLPHSFYINLQSDVFLWPHPDILLHINPHFRTATLIMNSWLKGTWGAEQSCPLLLRPGRPFSLKIKCDKDEFIVSIDGVAVGAYRYRASPHLIKAMYFQGDVFIKEITLS